MGLTGAYDNPVPDDVGIAIIKHAFSKGITFFDTADVYGPFTNEVLVGKVTAIFSLFHQNAANIFELTMKTLTIYLFIYLSVLIWNNFLTPSSCAE